MTSLSDSFGSGSSSAANTLVAHSTDPLEFLKETLSVFFKAMHEGWITQWTDDHLTQSFRMTVCGKFDDPTEDRTCVGREAMQLYYNNVIEQVWGANSTISWVPLTMDIVSEPGATPICIKYIVDQRQICNTTGTETACYRLHYTTLVRDEESGDLKISGTVIKPSSKEQDMEPELVNCRNCIPSGYEEVPLPVPTLAKPCNHNSWDSVRVKRKWSLLRCRICTSQWRLRASDVDRCMPFTKDVCSDPKCDKLHIFLRKQRKADREREAAAESAVCG
eukprot:TRINITY_DN4646_c0_g1_i1.p1 TRINITY_DN4646_c0_g1~~TRINITY_DN4646_c0_g1_i1.p1  ORF type:complete len:302 (+),score=39.25 TRINITY_DN4646_c0_g1_i1:78-908(+)